MNALGAETADLLEFALLDRFIKARVREHVSRPVKKPRWNRIVPGGSAVDPVHRKIAAKGAI
jgi:hypothetical protein